MARERLGSRDSELHIINELPGKVDPNDIQGKKNGMLLTLDRIQKIKKRLNKKQHLTRTDFKAGQDPIFVHEERGYAAMRVKDNKGVARDYVIYRGKSQTDEDVTLGQGAFGRVKFAQNLDDGSWDVVKIQYVWDEQALQSIDIENKNLAKVGMGKGSITRDKLLIGGAWVQECLNKFNSNDHVNAYAVIEQQANNGNRLAKLFLKYKNEGEALHLLETAAKNQGNLIVKQVVSVVSYVPGKNLEKFLAIPDPNFSSYQGLAKDILQAYKDQVQDNDLVHRDIKPANIIFDPATGKVRFIDLGLARDIVPDDAAGDLKEGAGTPWYMAPERRKGVPATANEATEVHELGMTLREVLGFYKVGPSGHEKSNECMVRIPDPTERTNLERLVNMMISSKSPRPSVELCLQQLNNPKIDLMTGFKVLMPIVNSLKELESNFKQQSIKPDILTLKQLKEDMAQIRTKINSVLSDELKSFYLNQLKECESKFDVIKLASQQLALIQDEIKAEKKADPKKLLALVDIVKFLRNEIENSPLNDAEKKEKYSQLSGVIESAQKKTNEFSQSRSYLTQIKHYAQEHVGHKKSTREKIEEVRSKLGEEKYNLHNPQYHNHGTNKPRG